MPRGSRGRSPSQAVAFLEGLHFPCSKAEMVNYAEEIEAPDEIIDLLEQLPHVHYGSRADVVSDVTQFE